MEKITLDLSYSILNSEEFTMSKELIDYTDNIYYKNGIMDKIYYDSSLTRANIKQTNFISNFIFKYRDLEFDNIDNLDVDIIVSIIVPEKNYNDHLELLACLSSKLDDSSVRKELRQARNSSQIIKNFQSDDLEYI